MPPEPSSRMAPIFSLGFFAWKNQQASVVQAKFLKGLCIEKVELELGQRIRRQILNLLFDFGSQRAELGFHLPQGRPPLVLLDAAFDTGKSSRANFNGDGERFSFSLGRRPG